MIRKMNKTKQIFIGGKDKFYLKNINKRNS